mmetsp:Transcript_20148/g.60801  ORF Transcript_20148/g.60801 Transcript_20148/m.60801 type:complete len:224 (-) Transcript_20148:91-762(-)
MLHPNFLWLSSPDLCCHINKHLLALLRAILSDLVLCIVCGGRQPNVLRLNLTNDQEGILAVVAHERSDVQVGLPYPWPGVVPAHNLLFRIDFFGHGPHVFDVAMVQKPDGRVPLILLKGYRKAVRDVQLPFVHLAQKHPHHPLASVLGHTVVVVHHAQQHQRMHHHRLRNRRHAAQLSSTRYCPHSPSSDLPRQFLLPEQRSFNGTLGLQSFESHKKFPYDQG